MKMEPSHKSESTEDDLRAEYDLSQLKGGIRGKYARHKKPQNNVYEQTSSIPKPAPNEVFSPEQVAFFQRINSALRPILIKSVVPIGCARNGEIGIAGTGTLFRVAGKSFLVTASHVFETAEAGGWELAIADNIQGGSARLPLQGRLQGHKEFDVVVWELPQDVVDGLRNCSFLTVHHTDRENQRPKKGVYYVFGYPEVLANVDSNAGKLTANPFTFMTGILDCDSDTVPDYDPKYHILLDTPKDGGRRMDDGDMPTPSRINGMSGCSIWQTYYEGLSSQHWTTDDAVIVGVQTGVYNGGSIIKGTRWWVVDRIIRECYPGLAGPLSLVTSTV
jgi:hypothetical protein